MKEKDILAVDAVINPPPEVADLANSLSRELRGSPIFLNSVDYFPHITLAMGYIQDVHKTKEAMGQIAENTNPFKVVVDKIVRGTSPFAGYYFSGLEMRKDPQLTWLHTSILDLLPFETIDNPRDNFFVTNPQESIVTDVYNYIRNFKDKHSREHYWPHITLGAGDGTEVLTPALPVRFQANKISLYQLGNFCTCRRLLGEWELKT